MVRGNALLVLDLALHIVDGVRGLDLEGDGLARQGLNEAVAKTCVSASSILSIACASRSMWRSLSVFAIRRRGDSWARVRTSALFILSVIYSRD